jgi:hypothetical protein
MIVKSGKKTTEPVTSPASQSRVEPKVLPHEVMINVVDEFKTRTPSSQA